MHESDLLSPHWPITSLEVIASLSPLEYLPWPELERCGVTLSLKREDLLHPKLGGNKIYKLWHYVKPYLDGGCHLPIASFGGAYSNHIYALGAIGALMAVNTIAVVRGERPKTLSPTLQDVETMGMRLHFVSREEYRKKDVPEDCDDVIQRVEQQFGQCTWIPEGGSGTLGIQGVKALGRAIMHASPSPPGCIVHACGTGTTLAGLISSVPNTTAILGISVLKGTDTIASDVNGILASEGITHDNWSVNNDYHGGGYAKLSSELRGFIHEFERATEVLLDPIYTAKMMWAIFDLAKKGYWPKGTRIVAVHSGGLQGRRGFKGL